MYPIGASNQTYKTFPSASGSGTLIPQSRSRVMARDCSPPSIQDLHWPYTFVFQSEACPLMIQSFNQPSYFSKGKYQCLVARSTGGLLVRVERGLINSLGLSVDPQFSH